MKLFQQKNPKQHMYKQLDFDELMNIQEGGAGQAVSFS